MAETTAFGNGGRRGTAFGLLGVILLAAGLLRVWAAAGDLWIDEVWSLENIALVRAQPTSGNWLALFFHANTHPLNTLYLAFLGPEAGVFAYRALSVASGVAAVAMAAALGWRRSATEGLIAAAMVAASYPMVHYAGEARGYATMVLAALACVYLLQTYLEAPSPGRALAFVAVSLLGFASHMSFGIIEAGLGLWAAAVLFQRLASPVSVIARLAVLFGVQAVALTAYGAVAWNNFVLGGGSPSPTAVSVNTMAEMTFGADPAAWGSITPVLGPALAAVVWWLYRRGDGSWIFFAAVALVFPLGFVVIDPPLDMAERYFITSGLAALILAARGLAPAMQAKRWPRALAIAALAGFFIGNGLLLQKFFTDGRGGYTKAARFIAAAGDGPVTVSGYQPLRAGAVLKFHASRAGLADALRYLTPEEESGAAAAWFIDGSFAGRRPPPEISRPIKGSGQTPYSLEGVYPHWGLSGDTWAIYRRTSNRRNSLPGNATSPIQSGKSPVSSR
jgi:hypothetical protein